MSISMARLVFVNIIILFTFVLSVDRSNFKTCDQSGFCRRHRNMKGQPSNWVLLPESIKAIVTQQNFPMIEANVKNNENGILLKLELFSVLKDGCVLRMRLNELHGGRERFEAREALVETIEFSQISLKSVTEKEAIVEFGIPDRKHKAVINVNPFRIDVFNGETAVISVNARGFLKFEHFRRKQQVGEMNDALVEEPDQNTANEGCWEETFKTFHDSKPFGPMSVGMDFSFIGFEHIYGIPEHADSFPLKDTRGSTDPYRLYNLDVFEYETNNPMALYGSIPIMLAHSAEQTVGLLWLNPSETWVDIESHNQGVVSLFSNLVSGDTKTRLTHWFSETGIIDVWMMLGPTPTDVISQNARLTGLAQLPPYYAIGNHQSRWNYFSQDEVNKVDQSFDENDIPLDAIWLDIEYTEDRSKKYFTWDPVKFSDPKTLIYNLTSKGRRLIAIIDPHLKKDSNYPVFNEAVQNNYLIKNKDGSDYEGWCWPGASMWPDFFNPSVQEWWSTKFNPEFFPGFSGGIVDIWNDMNEPSVFNGPEITCPKDVTHFNGLEHRDVHNMYNLVMIKSTFNGLIKHRPNLRPFILTRSFFVGSHRYAAVWTGDNMSKLDHLKISIPMLLSLSIVGISFCGADVPGFFYDPESTEFVVRWYQAGAFQPFFRSHAHIYTRLREPYLFDQNTRELITEAIRERYSYLPYIYTLFRENSINGMPIMRPLWFHFPKDERTFLIDNQYLLGDALLIHPVTDIGVSSINVYLPGEGETWLHLESRKVFKGANHVDIPVTLSSIPIFQRSATIIVKRERMRRSCTLTLNDPVTLQIFLNSEESFAQGKLYIDDGYTFDHKNGAYINSNITYNRRTLEYNIIHGGFPTRSWLEKVVLYRFSQKPSKIEVRGTNLSFKYTPEDQMLIIRKPAVTLADNWKIIIT